jgi:hypothetical protein
MYLPQEVRAFQKPIAGEHGFVASSGPKKRGVVANAQGESSRNGALLGALSGSPDLN